jgi:hypothetical protein
MAQAIAVTPTPIRPLAQSAISSTPAARVIATNAKGDVLTQAVPCVPHPDDESWWQEHVSGRWLVIERDSQTGRLRESTETYPSFLAASDAYWLGEVAYEPWITETWSSADLSQAA